MRRWLRSTPKEVLGDYVAKAVYGSVIALSVVATLNAFAPPPQEAIAAVLGATLAVVLAEVYAGRIGGVIRAGRPLTGEEKSRLWHESLAGLCGAIVPVVFFVLAALGVVADTHAFEWALWTGVVTLGLYALAAARITGAPWGRALAAGLGGASLGVTLILLKVLLKDVLS